MLKVEEAKQLKSSLLAEVDDMEMEVEEYNEIEVVIGVLNQKLVLNQRKAE